MTVLEGKREITITVSAGETVKITYDGYERFTMLNGTDGDLKVSSSNDFDDEYFIIPKGSGYSDYIPNPSFDVNRQSVIYLYAESAGQVSITSN